MEKIKVIIKRPDEEYGHTTWISNTLKNLQKTVEGHIETVMLLPDRDLMMICNEDGKNIGLDRNFRIGFAPFQETIVGTVIICGSDGEEFGDIPISMKEWKQILHLWGN